MCSNLFHPVTVVILSLGRESSLTLQLTENGAVFRSVIVELVAASRRLEFDFAAQLQLQQQAGDDSAAAGVGGGSADGTVFPWMELVCLQQKNDVQMWLTLLFL
eukprot:COSAG06_NODE_6202_length_3051_cov_6.132453_2_plen_104_part_00